MQGNYEMKNSRLSINTRITEMLGIQYPIIQGGMMWVGTAELASAVSNAGGLGTITALTQPTPDALYKEIARCREMTDQPFAVNLTLLPAVKLPPYAEYRSVIVESGIKIVETAGNKPHEHISHFKQNGIQVIHKCTSVRHARSAVKAGADIISIDGFECAGHPGEDDVPGLVLIPITADQIEVPIIASGGIADGRGLVAALALGADGINMGTRFCATVEAPIHDRIKQFYLDNDERSTHLLLRKLQNTSRVAKNSVSDLVVQLSQREDLQFEHIRPYMSGLNGKRALQTGDIDAGLITAGQTLGLIHDIPSCQDLINKIVQEAHQILQTRLSQFSEPR